MQCCTGSRQCLSGRLTNIPPLHVSISTHLHEAQASPLAGRLDPGQVHLWGVGGGGQQLQFGGQDVNPRHWGHQETWQPADGQPVDCGGQQRRNAAVQSATWRAPCAQKCMYARLTWQLRASNSLARSEKAMISVGHTKLHRGWCEATQSRQKEAGRCAAGLGRQQSTSTVLHAGSPANPRTQPWNVASRSHAAHEAFGVLACINPTRNPT